MCVERPEDVKRESFKIEKPGISITINVTSSPGTEAFDAIRDEYRKRLLTERPWRL